MRGEGGNPGVSRRSYSKFRIKRLLHFELLLSKKSFFPETETEKLTNAKKRVTLCERVRESLCRRERERVCVCVRVRER